MLRDTKDSSELTDLNNTVSDNEVKGHWQNFIFYH